ncbi:hypothetical protein HC744_16890 [Arthrobacter sp. S1_S22]|nr:hypothetical protein [Arthrobacter sp. S1_S22]
MKKWMPWRRSKAESAVVLGITNASSMGWAASQLETDKLALQQLREDQHHLYFIVAGPRLTPVVLNDDPDTGGWTLDIEHTTAEGQGTTTVPVPRTAFPGYSLALAKGGLSIVSDLDAGQRREVTSAEVVRAALRAQGAARKRERKRYFPERHIRYEMVDGVETLISVEDIPANVPASEGVHSAEDWVDPIVDALFIFDVIYIGKAYGTEGARTAIDRLSAHEKAQPAIAYVHDYQPDRSVGFITINQRMTSVDNLHIDSPHGYPDKIALVEWVKEQAEVLDSDALSETTVDAAESVLIGTFKPPRNQRKLNFSNTTTSVKQLRKMGYTHLQVRIDLNDSFAKLRGPNNEASSNHNLTFNLKTKKLETPGDTAWNQFLTGH